MNTEEAIKILKLHNRIITKISNKKYHIFRPCDPIVDDELLKTKTKTTRIKDSIYFKDIVSARELINLARDYTSDNNSNTVMKKLVKEEDRSKNRSATKRIIKEEKFDDLGPANKAKSGNIRNWD